MNETQGVLSVGRTSMFLFIRLVLLNRSVMSDHVLRSSQKRGLLLSFYLGGSSGCKDVFPKISLLNKIFEILLERPALRSLVSLAVMDGVVVFGSGTSRIVWLRFWTLHPGLTLDGFEHILDRKFQWSKAVIHPVDSKWAL